MIGRLRILLEFVKFEHTLFALPFAFLGAALAASGWPGWRVAGWVTLAMVGARSAAMAFNRIADRRYDSLNPRTQNRPLISGSLNLPFAWLFLAAAAALFVFSASMLNRLAFLLSWPALAIVLGYSLTKRFTAASHVVLGLALGIAPVGGWVAVRGTIDPAPVLLALAVLCWTAGFDIIYACLDVAFDQRVGLHSLPRRLGIGRALQVSSGLHAAMVVLLAVVGMLCERQAIFAAGLALVALVLWIEHRLVRPDDLSRINAAFFTANGWLSVGFFLLAALDLAIYP
ncbi:MAG: UbiA-like polyprenyltransferase [Acidobacteriota bacterium]